MKNTTRLSEPKRAEVSTTSEPEPNIEVPETAVSPLTKAQSEVEATYSAHIEAQKGFEEAFRNMARQDESARKDAERRFQAYQKATEQAMTKRETNEQAALDTYRKTMKKAGEVYRQAMRQALDECQQTTETARKVLTFLSGAESRPAGDGRVNLVVRLRHATEKGLSYVKSQFWRWSRQARSFLVRAD